MSSWHKFWLTLLSTLPALALAGCGGGAGMGSPPPPASYMLTVTAPAMGAGTVTSSPAGINCPTTCSASFTKNTQIVLTATAGSNYFFGGWSGSCSGTSTCTVILAAAASVTATFNPGDGLTVALAGIGTVISSPAGINCPTTCSASFPQNSQVTLSETPGTNNAFAGWSGGCSGTSTCTLTLAAAASVTATFNGEDTLTVALAGTGTVTSSPAGINCPTTCSASFPQNSQVTLSETPGANNSFASWSGGCSGTSTCTLTLAAAASVTATFNGIDGLTVALAGAGTGTITSSPPGINCPTTCSASFPQNTQVTLTATAGSSYFFGGWSGACSGSSACSVTLAAPASVTATFNPGDGLTVTLAGAGTGTITSSPAGINCPTTCSASFAQSTQVTLSETPGTNNTFAGWSGACTGVATCSITIGTSNSVTATFGATLQSINHIIIFAQENRSFDHYFGALRAYWAANGFPDQSFDGLPQFNPATGIPPLQGPIPAIPGCDPTQPYPPYDVCVPDTSNLISSFHFASECQEEQSPFWNESHVDWDYNDPQGNNPAALNGFVISAANDARQQSPTLMDTNGIRAMGYFDESDLNYYYFMASDFATSDRWFSPVMDRTQLNRMYLLAATSAGHAYPLAPPETPLAVTTIFEALQNAGVTWKIYVDPAGTSCSTDPTPTCLLTYSYINQFTYGETIVNSSTLSQNLVPISQYTTDVQNGTLPQVALIEPASSEGLDEHPSDYDTSSPTNVQPGAQYAASLINALMTSTSWSDSALIFTYDEAGGFYDHVSPQPMPSPDGIAPMDLEAGDICDSTGTTGGATCDFTWTGYRLPMIVISPFAKKNYVSHTVYDYTAVLKLIETRFNLSALTLRDAAQADMSTDFFDFVNKPWATPPTPPAQVMTGQCTLTPPTS